MSEVGSEAHAFCSDKAASFGPVDGIGEACRCSHQVRIAEGGRTLVRIVSPVGMHLISAAGRREAAASLDYDV